MTGELELVLQPGVLLLQDLPSGHGTRNKLFSFQPRSVFKREFSFRPQSCRSPQPPAQGRGLGWENGLINIPNYSQESH